MRTIHFLICCFLFIVQSTLYGQQLDMLIKEAIQNSPELQKMEMRFKIAEEKIEGVQTLPNTQIGFGYFVSEPETRTGAQRFKLSASQMIPWFGTITARTHYARAMADSEFENIAIAQRKLVASVSQSYTELYILHEKKWLAADQLSLLKTFEKLLLQQVEVGKASAVDVLRLSIRMNEVSQLEKVLEQQIQAEEKRLNVLLNRETPLPIQITETFSIQESDTVVGANLHLHPELTKYDKLYEAVSQSELLNQKESSPQLGFGIDYVSVSERPNMTFAENGKDIVMPMVSVSIPLFNKKYRSQTKQNELKQLEIASEKKERLNTLQNALDKAVYEKSIAKINYDTSIKSFQQAKQAEQILIKSFESSSVPVNEILAVQELQLKIKMNQIEALRKYVIQSTLIHYLSTPL